MTMQRKETVHTGYDNIITGYTFLFWKGSLSLFPVLPGFSLSRGNTKMWVKSDMCAVWSFREYTTRSKNIY